MTVDYNSPDLWTNLGSAISAEDELEFQSAISKFLASNVAFDNYLHIAYFAAELPVVLSHESQSPRVHAEIETHYVQSHYLLDPFYIAHCNAVRAGAYSLSDVAPDKFRSTAYFKKYYERTTLQDEIAFFAYPANGWTLNICIGRDETSGLSFSKADIRRARRIAPVVSSLTRNPLQVGDVPQIKGRPFWRSHKRSAPPSQIPQRNRHYRKTSSGCCSDFTGPFGKVDQR